MALSGLCLVLFCLASPALGASAGGSVSADVSPNVSLPAGRCLSLPLLEQLLDALFPNASLVSLCGGACLAPTRCCRVGPLRLCLPAVEEPLSPALRNLSLPPHEVPPLGRVAPRLLGSVPRIVDALLGAVNRSLCSLPAAGPLVRRVDGRLRALVDSLDQAGLLDLPLSADGLLPPIHVGEVAQLLGPVDAQAQSGAQASANAGPLGGLEAALSGVAGGNGNLPVDVLGGAQGNAHSAGGPLGGIGTALSGVVGGNHILG